ncbi:MAG: flavin reductase family protein [Kaistella sp.]|nr:flavin reductase family protein [Kaistella sp.]
MIIDKITLAQSEKRFLAQLINSLAGIRQVALIGTKSKKGNENLAVFNSLIHLGAHPALFGLISRPASAERHTLGNIRETESYTVNFLDKKYAEKVHQTSARYPENISEFTEVSLTPEYFQDCFAPFVKEAEIKIEMKLQQILNLEINNTNLIIGSIERIYLPEERLLADGFVNPRNLLLSCGLDAYFTGKFAEKLAYAKP